VYLNTLVQRKPFITHYVSTFQVPNTDLADFTTNIRVGPYYVSSTVGLPLFEHLCASSITSVQISEFVQISEAHSLIYKVMINYSNKTYTTLIEQSKYCLDN